ncbi:MAG: AMP-binding protein, partial [Oscillospiraceae bacterium]|nr:AMP-binding protein [Oscillospiraceae bacterium]
MLPLENITVGALLRRTAALFPNRSAVIDHGKKLSYREFDELTDRFATALLRRGIGYGDHVALFGEAEAEVLALFFAIQRIGAVAVMVNTALVRTDLETVLRLGDPKLACIGISYQKERSLPADVSAIGDIQTLKGIFTVG